MNGIIEMSPRGAWMKQRKRLRIVVRRASSVARSDDTALAIHEHKVVVGATLFRQTRMICSQAAPAMSQRRDTASCQNAVQRSELLREARACFFCCRLRDRGSQVKMLKRHPDGNAAGLRQHDRDEKFSSNHTRSPKKTCGQEIPLGSIACSGCTRGHCGKPVVRPHFEYGRLPQLMSGGRETTIKTGIIVTGCLRLQTRRSGTFPFGQNNEIVAAVACKPPPARPQSTDVRPKRQSKNCLLASRFQIPPQYRPPKENNYEMLEVCRFRRRLDCRRLPVCRSPIGIGQ